MLDAEEDEQADIDGKRRAERSLRPRIDSLRGQEVREEAGEVEKDPEKEQVTEDTVDKDRKSGCHGNALS